MASARLRGRLVLMTSDGAVAQPARLEATLAKLAERPFIDAVFVRDADATTEQRAELASRLLTVLRRMAFEAVRPRLIVADGDVHAAELAGADGVHWPRHAWSSWGNDEAQAMLHRVRSVPSGPRKNGMASAEACSNLATRAAGLGFDVVVLDTSCSESLGRTTRRVKALGRNPRPCLLSNGVIDESNCNTISASGGDGFAVSCVWDASDPEAVCAALGGGLDLGLSQRGFEHLLVGIAGKRASRFMM